MVAAANIQYAWTLFVPEIQKTFGWDRAAIQVAFTEGMDVEAGAEASHELGQRICPPCRSSLTADIRGEQSSSC
ncbi:hypothetical protein HNR01_005456 [Methylorubrum rhodesianum]|nr:hypothetical protein [Methylorubrum rhodesianum]